MFKEYKFEIEDMESLYIEEMEEVVVVLNEVIEIKVIDVFVVVVELMVL